MSNTVYNKVTVNGTTYIDLSQDTVSDASHIKYGYTGHLNDGTQVTGTLASGGVVISDTLDENGGTIRTITTVETPVSLQTKSNITPGASSVTVTPDTGYDGMTSVQVNGDANLVAANIKSGVTIFGVTGTHEGSSGSGSGSGSGITQDQDGYIILPSTGSGGGTWQTVYSGEVTLDQTDDNTYYYTGFTYTDSVELNSVWRITWNGTPYERTATLTGDSNGDPYAIGNGTIVGLSDGNNEPFFIQRFFGNTLMIFAAQSQLVNIVIEKQVSSSGTETSGVTTTITGTFTGDGTNIAQIACDFEPQEIYIYGDLSGDVSLRGIVLIKNNTLYVIVDGSQSNNDEVLSIMEHNIIGYNQSNSSTQTYASYSNNILTIDTVNNTSSTRFASGITYSYKLVGVTSPTQHTIHFEFSDSTETDINVYYDDAFISSLITSTTPTLYGQKTVFIAALDNVTWYDANAIPIGVELIDYTKCTQDYAIDSDGTVYAEQWYCVSDYTPIMPGQTYSYTGIYWFNMAFYDSTKTLISALSMYQDGTQDTENTNVCHGTLSGNKIPSNAAYVRITGGYNPSDESLSLIRTA